MNTRLNTRLNTKLTVFASVALLGAALATIASFNSGCVTKKVRTVSTDPATGALTTNTVTQVNTNNLMLDCAVLKLMGTPAVTYVLANDKSGNARAIVTDIQTALRGALNGTDPDITATINGFISNDASVRAQFTPLIQAASALRGQLLAKYGDKVGVQIGTAILQTDLDIVTSALAAVPKQ